MQNNSCSSVHDEQFMQFDSRRLQKQLPNFEHSPDPRDAAAATDDHRALPVPVRAQPLNIGELGATDR